MKKLKNNMNPTTYDANDVARLTALQYATDTRFQVRKRLDHKVVSEYAKAMAVGAKFPPIKLANIKGVLFLIDGYHRVAAAREAAYALEAIIVDMTERQALREAAVANLTHGLRLKQGERVRAFQAFIKGGGHRKENRELKSYRELALELHGLGGHTTIRNWMFKFFPKIAREYGKDAQGNSRAESPRLHPERERAKQFSGYINDAAQLLPAVKDPYLRSELRKQAIQLLATFEGETLLEPDF